MKKILKYIPAFLIAGTMLPVGFSSCSGMGGDGIDSVLWNGSTNPQSTSFHNPVWEPSLEAGTVIKGASSIAAISVSTQWAAGITYNCPTLLTNNLMDWKQSSDAFSADGMPAWGEKSARITSLSADYAKTVAKANVWMFYTLEGKTGIGAAWSAITPQGTYSDLGQIALKTETDVVKDPFFIVAGTTAFYLCYTTEKGTYLQKLTLKRGELPKCSGEPKLIAGTAWSDVALYRASATDVYIFGVVDGSIVYARAENIAGPYHDKAGAGIADGSKGEALVTTTSTYNVVENPMRMFPNSDETVYFLAYNAVKADKQTLASGYARKPMFLQPMKMNADGWFETTYSPQEGWTSPRYN